MAHNKFNPWALYIKDNEEAESETIIAATWELLRRNQDFRMKYLSLCEELEAAYKIFLSRLSSSELALQNRSLVQFYKGGIEAYEKVLWKKTGVESNPWMKPRTPECSRLLQKMHMARKSIFCVSKTISSNSSHFDSDEIYLKLCGGNDVVTLIMRAIVYNTLPTSNALPEYKILSEIIDKSYVQLSPSIRDDLKYMQEFTPLSDWANIVTFFPEDCLNFQKKHPNHYICGYPIPPVGISRTKLKTVIKEFVEEFRDPATYKTYHREKSIRADGETLIIGSDRDDYVDSCVEAHSYYLFAVSKNIHKGSQTHYESQIYQHLSPILSGKKRFSLESIIGSKESWDGFLSWEYTKERYLPYFTRLSDRFNHKNSFLQRLSAYHRQSKPAGRKANASMVFFRSSHKVEFF